MLKAVKEKISNYLSPIVGKENNSPGEGTSSVLTYSDSLKRKRPINIVDECSERFGKKKKEETIKITSPLNVFHKWNWQGIFKQVVKGNNDSDIVPQCVKSELSLDHTEDLTMGSRKILSATRRNDRYALSQISNTTLLDLTNIDDNDNNDDDEPEVTKLNIDLMTPSNSFSQPTEVNDDEISNIAAGSRKISATRRNDRYALSQLSNTTLLDLTSNVDDDDDDDDNDKPEVTKFSVDLTTPPTNSFSLPSHVNDVEISNVAVVNLINDDRKNKPVNTFGQFPSSNMIGPLRRQKSGSILHETIRLDEKTRYKSLLAQYTNTNLPEYSKSISPDKQPVDSAITVEDSVSSLSPWLDKGHVDNTPVTIDLTGEDSINKPTIAKTPSSTGRKFFHELLSQTRHSPPFQYNMSDTKLSSPLLSVRSPGMTVSSNTSTHPLLDTEWIQKWYGVLDPLSLERERRINEEEKRKEAIKRKQQEEFEELEKKNKEKAKVTTLVELSAEMKRMVKSALGPGSSKDVLVEGFNAEVTRADISTLRKSTWLNDEIVNFYFNLIKKRGETIAELPNVHVFNTFFYPKIMKVGHSGVKRWTRKIDIFSFDLILIPVHLGMHWCMAAIDNRTKQIIYYDSLRGNNPQCLVALRTYMNEESKDKKKCEFNFDGWTESMPKQIPEQMNGCDCGVFACMYAEYKSRNAEFTFTQANMPYFRERMVYEIISMALL